MNIKFKIFKLKKNSKTYQKWSERNLIQNEVDREMIIVGEEKIGDKSYLKVSTFDDKGLCLVNGLMLDDLGYYVPAEDIEYTNTLTEFDIPKKFITLEILENIQRINEDILQ